MEVLTKVKEKWSKRKKIIIIAAIIVVIGSVISVFFFVRNMQEGTTESKNDFANGFVVTEDTVYAAGTTAIGVVSEEFEPDYITSDLYIEEVYVATGDVITEETKLLKISEDSIIDAREELETAAESADLAYRAGLIEYEQGKITAKYDYDITLLESEQAKEVYEDTMLELNSRLEEKQEAVEESEEIINTYTDAINNNTYASEYGVEEKQATYDENLAILQTKSEEWGIPYDAFISPGGGSSSYDPWELITLKELYEELEENLEDLEDAEEEYNNMIENASLLLAIEELNLESLKSELYEFQETYDIQAMEAETTYQKALAKSALVESDYETELSKIEEEYNDLLDAKEDADENLIEFEALIGDGYFYSSSAGTILRTAVSEDRYLLGESVVVEYSNPEIVTVSVDVDQADISKIDIGDSAYVIIDGYGEYMGIVEEINPISTSTSRTSITYEVTVSIESEDGNITSNLVAGVYFQMGEEAE
jgi:multidrug resistance efflux pump